MKIGDQSMLTVPDFDRTGPIRHGFTTRRNGLGSRVNGIKQQDDWNSIAREFGIPGDRVVTVNQVHGNEVLLVDNRNFNSLGTERADGMITREPGIALGIETADCVPVLLLDPAVPAIGAIHAGWRSTVELIVQKAVSEMGRHFGSDPSRMTAAIGPAIGPECYEVDEPVMGPIREAFPFWKETAQDRGNGKWGLDLAALNRLELAAAGLSSSNIYSLNACTSCRRDLFYSYRAEGRTGRMLSVIMIRPRTNPAEA